MADVELCRYYSPAWLGSLLAASLPELAPRLIIDLGCGPGVLSGAAGARWANASLVTVDIDSELAGSRSRSREIVAAMCGRQARHVFADVTRPRLRDALDVHAGAFDVALSNPPYGTVAWRPGFATIMRRVGLGRALTAGGGAPLDVIFLAQALHLLRPGGSLGFIVPDSTISGVRSEPLRALLLDLHGIERVVQLPRSAFRRTDAQAFAIVLRKGVSGGPVRLDRVDREGRWSSPVLVDRQEAVGRLDHEFHAGRAGDDGETLAALGVLIRRGRISSSGIAGAGAPVFHTCDFPAQPGGGITLAGRCPSGGRGMNDAEPGDILVARVDRRLEEKVAFVASGWGAISDCVMRLRCPPEVRDRVLGGLTGPEGRARLARISRGSHNPTLPRRRNGGSAGPAVRREPSGDCRFVSRLSRRTSRLR